jgi:energy-coupling factor transporter ATP-binding protein EcfA2
MRDFPGARWWKFDFHTHTPASIDYGNGSNHEILKAITPRDWLLGFMQAGIDCLAVTDHNSGEWIDRLKEALLELENSRPSGFRKIHLFPGVEITANGGVHVLAVFDRTATSSDVTRLLGAVGYRGAPGSSDLAAESAPIQIVQEIAQAGAIPILAHVDMPKGAFERSSDGSFKVPGNTLRSLFESQSLYALEICQTGAPKPALYAENHVSWAELHSSDSHFPDSASGKLYPGGSFSWVKMGEPSLEGLRLALVDGNGISIRRSDEPASTTDPNQHPENVIESIQISQARYMGHSHPEILQFSPWLNAIVGGRGTGKSTVVHFLRAALHRDDEIQRLDERSLPRATYDDFMKIPRHRTDSGGLREQTSVEVVFVRHGVRYRLNWPANGSHATVQEATVDGQWEAAASQEVRERFPVRIFSQGQIAALAGERNDALLDLVDQAIDAAAWQRQWVEEEKRFMALRARHREVAQKLAGRDRIRGQLDDVRCKLAQFEAAEHATVLRDFQRRTRQEQEIELQASTAAEIADRYAGVTSDAVLADLPDDLFNAGDAGDQSALSLLDGLRHAVRDFARRVDDAVNELRSASEEFRRTIARSEWHNAVESTRGRYEELVRQLQAQGVDDPSEYGKLVQDRQRLESEEKQLASLEQHLADLDHQAMQSLDRLAKLRREIIERRERFLSETLGANPYVRVELEPYGRNPQAIEQSFREVLGVADDRFKADINDEDGQNSLGFVPELLRGLPADKFAATDEIEKRLTDLKGRLTQTCQGSSTRFGGHLSNYLDREYQRRPEILDRLLVWFPSDSLKVTYSPKGDGQSFRSITQASAGQRAAAMLAFFLAYGHEPIILDQPEDDLDNHLIYDLVVKQIRANKLRRQIITVTHNPNIVVNGDAEMLHAFDYQNGRCCVVQRGCLQNAVVRDEICRVMEGGREAFELRYRRIGKGGRNV